MMRKMKLDALERGILHILQEDGRASYSEMARRLGIPRINGQAPCEEAH